MAIQDMTSQEMADTTLRLNDAIKKWDLVAHYAARGGTAAVAEPIAIANEIQQASNWLFTEWYKHQ